jgi:hypothetical protein
MFISRPYPLSVERQLALSGDPPECWADQGDHEQAEGIAGWFPVNYLVIRALLQNDQFFGPDFTVEYHTRSGQQLTLREVAGDLADRLVSIWLPVPDGRRPVYGGVDRMQTDQACKDNLLFCEYFHGDNGAGLVPCTKPGGPPWSRTC